MSATVHRIVKLARGNARERALYASNTPPSQPDGRNVGGLTRRIRRACVLSVFFGFAAQCALAVELDRSVMSEKYWNIWNDVYKATFTNLWNAATLPFYWNRMESVKSNEALFN